jgi:hypothetical protein
MSELMDSFRQVMNSIYTIAINPAVLRRAAAPLSPVVTTLGAIQYRHGSPLDGG